MLVLGGLWAAWLGYGILYAGIAKLGGDTGCTLGRAFRGQCGQGTAGRGGPAPRGLTSAAYRQRARQLQLDLIPRAPVRGMA